VKNVFKQMKANPKVEISAYDGAGKWVRVTATVVSDDRLEAKKHMLDAYPELKDIYKADDDNTAVLYLKDATATFYSFMDEPREINF
jgi:uncharacterized pyridoxamine 5'-phosphate oxidase family protein